MGANLADACNVPLFGLERAPGENESERRTDSYQTTDGAARAADLANPLVTMVGVNSADSTVADALDALDGVAWGYISLTADLTQGCGSCGQTVFELRRDTATDLDTFLTTRADEAAFARTIGYVDVGDGVLGYVEPSTSLQTLYRLYNDALQDHAYVVGPLARDALLGDGYVEEQALGSVLLTSTKAPLTNDNAILCTGGGAVRNENPQRNHYLYAGPPPAEGTIVTATFDLLTGNYFSGAPREHLVAFIGEPGLDDNLQMNGLPRRGRALVLGSARGCDGAGIEDLTGSGPPIFDCQPWPNGASCAPPQDCDVPPDETTYQVTLRSAPGRFSYAILDASGAPVLDGFLETPPPFVPNGARDVLVGLTDDTPESSPGPLQVPAYAQIRNANVTFEPGASVDITPSLVEVPRGQDATYAVTVTNNTDFPITDVTLVDTKGAACTPALPSSLAAYQSFVTDCTHAAPAQSFTNTFTLQASSVHAVNVTTTADVEIDVVNAADLSIRTDVGVARIPASVVLDNDGPDVSNDVTTTVTFESSGQWTIIPIGGPGPCVEALATGVATTYQRYNCKLSSVAVQSPQELRYAFDVAPATPFEAPLTFAASVSSGTADPNPANDADTTVLCAQGACP